MSNAVHTFLPWARQGLASQIADTELFDGITAPANFGATMVRGKIDAYVHINNGADGTHNVPLQIIGPGDVIGIHKDVVIKTEPAHWITNFEPRNFPFIDFYEEDFPWRYSPAKPKFGTGSPTGKLRPWVTLVVLKESEFERETVQGAHLGAISLSLSTTPSNRPLPPVDELWAWAHVSVDKELTGTLNDAFNAAVNANPNIAISRMICPRKLEENTSYYAFLIPTYETGRLAGLGKEIPNTIEAQKPAWNHSAAWSMPDDAEPWLFPVYYEWYFRTGATGDFEYLVRQLQPKIPDFKVGRRMMDVSSPGYALSFTAGTPGVDQGTETLEGALRIPGTASPEFAYYYSGSTVSSAATPQNLFRDQIKNFVNLGEDMLVNPGTNPYHSGPGFPDATDQSLLIDPIVAPPLYGRWHALRSKVDPNNGALNWLNELNLDPRYRLAAGLGVDYVRKHQEYLMQKAWEQVGPIIEANTAARLAQLAQATAAALHKKHIINQPMPQLLPMTRAVHGRILDGAITIEQEAIDSSLPDSAPTSAFRRITSPNSPLLRRTDPIINQPANNVMENMRVGGLSPVEPKAQPGNNVSTFTLSTLKNVVSTIQGINTTNVSFNISVPGGPPVSPSPTVAANFKTAMGPYGNVFDTSNWSPPVARPNLTPTTATITDSINPEFTHTRSFYSRVYISTQPPVPDDIVEIMTAPSYYLPMYKAVLELGLEYLIPNLHLLPQNSVTVFESNQQFVEAFLVGANYEMGRELLWREYPTDQRGTYFKHFWGGMDSNESETNTRDIQPIHLWSSMSPLGSHSGRPGGQGNPLVLAFKGDLLRKFSNAVMYMAEAAWDPAYNGSNYWDKPRILKPNGARKFPVFRANVDPDITFLGFDIPAAAARGSRQANALPSDAGWFLVFQERPSELRFGLDYLVPPTSPAPNLNTWNDLAWDHVSVTSAGYPKLALTSPVFNTGTGVTKKLPVGIGTVDIQWAEDSVSMAMILYQNPVLAAIHCYEMIP